jgi:Ca2+-binding EF-hand superfamily protein
MKKTTYVIKLIGLSTVLSASLAIAEDLPTTFEQFDADGNGYISTEEATARQNLSDNFQASDKNGDGKLNSAEFSAFEGQGRFTPPEASEIPEPGAAPY